ncbi:MAG: Nse1 non-SMC component of SMC5-6 complex-domain-containing protein [Monoraphidium minutum]|nr:MAG: Nse1 non-SMC component of SMC5-6 complex-domain-containing protein [Monoraphidium minutum]
MAPRKRDRVEDPDAPGPSGRGGGGGGGGSGVHTVHRQAFTQHLMKHGYMAEEKAMEAFQRLTGLDSDDAYKRMVADQNREMAPFNLQIKTMKYPLDEQRYVGFINTHADAPSKFGTRFTPQEREFFRTVIEEIARDPRAEDGVGALSSIELLNLAIQPQNDTQQQDAGAGGAAGASSQPAGAAPKMAKAAKEGALRKFVADGWLKHGLGAGQYSLGVRTFLELGPQLLELPDLPAATRDAWQDLM